MPNIREFTDPIRGLQPDDKGSQAAVMAARHVEGLYAQAGNAIAGGIEALGDQYVKQKSFQDISHGLATSPEMQTGLGQQWNQIAKTSDPNDHSVAEKFINETVNPALDKWQEGFTTEQGRSWAMEHAAAIRQHFTEKTVADQSSLAGTAAVDNHERFVRGMASMVQNDPTSLNHALGTVDTELAALLNANPNVTPEVAGRMQAELRSQDRKAIFMAAGYGMVQQNPAAAKLQFQDPKWGAEDIDPAEREHLTATADAIGRAHDEDGRRAALDAKTAEKTAAQTAMTQLYAEGIGKGENGTWAPPPNYNQRLTALILQHPAGIDLSEAHAAQQMVATYTEDQASGRLVTSNPATFHDMLGRTTLAPGQPGALTRAEIFQSAASRALSKEDATMLYDALDKNNDPSIKHMNESLKTFIESKKASIMGAGLGMPDPAAADRFYAFEHAMQNSVAVAQSRGMKPDEVERTLLNPGDKNFLGDNQSVWMHFYTTGKLPPGTTLPAAAGRPPASGPAAPAPAAGQPPPVAGKLNQDQVNQMLFGK